MIDATVAGADANSYLAVADADALATDDFGPDREAWLAAGGEQKEQALKRATLELDDALRSGWARFALDQALLFPRSIDYTGSPAVAFLPARIRRATYYQAAYLIRNARVLAGADTRRARQLASASEPSASYSIGNRSSDGSWSEAGAPMLASRAEHVIEGFRRSGGARGLRSIRMTATR